MKGLFLEFLKEELEFLNDRDLYALYVTYRRKKVEAFENNNSEEYKNYSEITNVLRSEIIRRC